MDTMINISQDTPEFQLSDLNGEIISLRSLRGWVVVLNFWSAECDWCSQVDEELSKYKESWKDKVKVLLIASNANESRDLIASVVAERKLDTVLLDPFHYVADLFAAQTTPHFFIVGSTGRLEYQGAWDNRNFRQRVATQLYVPQVVEALLADQPLPFTHTQPYGCALVRVAG